VYNLLPVLILAAAALFGGSMDGHEYTWLVSDAVLVIKSVNKPHYLTFWKEFSAFFS